MLTYKIIKNKQVCPKPFHDELISYFVTQKIQELPTDLKKHLMKYLNPACRNCNLMGFSQSVTFCNTCNADWCMNCYALGDEPVCPGCMGEVYSDNEDSWGDY